MLGFSVSPSKPYRLFNPLDLLPVLWLDANQGVYSDDGETLAVADSVAYRWSDLSGNNFHVSQVTESKRPTLKAGIINGQNVLRFDGSDDLLLRPEQLTTALLGSVFAVVATTDPTTGAPYFLSAADESGAINTLRFGRINTGALRVFQQNGDTADNLTGNLIEDTGFHLIHISSSGSAYSGRLDGVIAELTAAAGSNSGDWFGDTEGLDNTVIGALKHTSEVAFWNGDIAEILVLDSVPDTATRRQIEMYFKAKYGLPIA